MRRAVRQALLLALLFAVYAVAGAVESGRAAVNDIQLYYEIQGEGEPLLLLHGGFGHTAYWHEQTGVFAARYKVIAVDSRGHGRSSLSAQPLSYSLMASDVLALMDQLGIDKAHIVGWSDGGNIGLDIAIHHPERLLKLVAYGANYLASGVRSDVGDNAKFKAFIEQARLDYTRLSPTPAGWDAFVDNISKMWATEPAYSDAQMRSIKSRVLVLDGVDEEAIYIDHAKAMAALIPGAELVLMPGTGHFAMWEQPQEFNRIVLDFLAR